MKKVILILANKDTGLYKFRKELIERLVNQGSTVYISVPNGPYVQLLEDLGCKYIETSINRRGKNPITDLKLLINYVGIIKKLTPDVVLTFTIKPNIYGGLACRLLSIPYISNITGLGTAVENKGVLQTLTLSLYKISLKAASCVFFQNKENQQLLEDNNIVTSENNKLIPGSGVNLDHFKFIDYPKSDERIEFLFIARVMKEKGIDQYLEAAKHVTSKYLDTVFHILGDCDESYLEKLEQMHDRGIVLYHGRVNDVREFHKISHCTIHPTFYPEGMSNVLLESAASGRPVITTNRSGCREIVDVGLNGYVVEMQNSQDLIDKIEKFLRLSNEEKKKMGLAGRQKVEKEFDRQVVVDSYMEQIQKEIG